MIWIAPICLPLAVALLLGSRALRQFALNWLLPIAALPGLALALLAPVDSTLYVPWLGLGVHLGFGEAGQVFLFFTALLWSIAAAFARSYLVEDAHRFRFGFFFLLCMTGNLGLTVAQDLPTFYTFFTLVALAAYPLVIHSHSTEAHRAGRIYLTMTIFGEMLLLAAFFLAVNQSESLLFRDVRVRLASAPNRDLILLLAFFGFGVKAGALPVHFWLPLAHPVAPVPASALLSGAMIKAGLLGWIQFLPLGHGAFPMWSGLFIAAGLTAAFYGVCLGLLQNDPKTNLAYSSISQMGIMTIAVGAGLMDAAAWPPARAVLLIYALNHALAKGALFLGVGVAAAVGPVRWRRRLVLGGLTLAALAIAGAPWTGGAIAKDGLKIAAGIAPSYWYPWMDWLLPLASVGTALLLTRFLLLISRRMDAESRAVHGSLAGLVGPWSVLLAGVALCAAFAVGYYGLEVERGRQTPGELWAALWPVLLGIALLLAFRRLLGKRTRDFRVPAGDLVVVLEWAVRRLKQAWDRWPAPNPVYWQFNLVELVNRIGEAEARRAILSRGESRLACWEIAGLVFIIVLILLLLSLMAGP